MPPLLYNGDCIDEMKKIPDGSIDMIWTDLPYATKTFGKCVDCEWDNAINLPKMWDEFMRIKKLNAPIFFSCNVKLGYDLIRTAPKKCPFRYDLIWVKSAPTSFLSARKMPMRKHELIYVFYEKLPFYDLSSHTHKFKKTKPRHNKNNIYGMKAHQDGKEGSYDPPLPKSVLKEDVETINFKAKNSIFGDIDIVDFKGRNGGSRYEPPLPISVINEVRISSLLGEEVEEELKTDIYGMNHKICQAKGYRNKKYEPPLPTSVNGEKHVYKTDLDNKTDVNGNYKMNDGIIYNGGKALTINRNNPNGWTSPLPTSVNMSWRENNKTQDKPYMPPKARVNNLSYADCYNFTDRVKSGKLTKGDPTKQDGYYEWEPKLPVSYIDGQAKEVCPVCSGYPDTILEIASKKGKHSTQKPTDLIKWCLKYYSREGDTILDCCMGSGSTGVACVEMNREFIGIELNEDIFKVAQERVLIDAVFKDNK